MGEPVLYQEAYDFYKNNELVFAEKLLIELMLKRPKVANFHNLIGCVYLKDHRLNLSKLHFEEAIKLNPTLWEPYYNMAVLQARLNNLEVAMVYFRKTIEVNKEHYPSKYNIGTIYLKKGQYQKAIEMFLNVKKAMPCFAKNNKNLDYALKKVEHLMENKQDG